MPMIVDLLGVDHIGGDEDRTLEEVRRGERREELMLELMRR